MKILISSHAFSPNRGGLETASRLLAEEFARRGHEVRLVTQTPGGDADDAAFPFEVIRQPEAGQLWSLHRWCDVVWHNHLSLRTAWPLLFCAKPWFVTHQTWLPGGGWNGRLKRAVLRRGASIAISEPIAAALRVPSQRIPNPYDDRIFRELPGSRPKELIAVGRLVSDKGFDVLIDALGELEAQEGAPRLTLVGDGSEEGALRELAERKGLSEKINFTGPKSGETLAALLREHRVLVVPSRWEEPFGIVALEGIACGCFAIGSRGGGLPEAIGLCGVTFPNGDREALAARIREALAEGAGDVGAEIRAAHLARFKIATVGAAYLEMFAEVLKIS